MNILKRLAAFTAILALLVVPTPALAATNDETITLSPTAKRYTVDPGQTISDTITVTNTGGKEFSFITYARPYYVSGDDYTPVFSTVNNKTDAYRWVTFEGATYSAVPTATVKIPFTLTVPKNAASGGHYGVIFAETQPASESGDKNQVFRKKRVGALLYVTVKGNNVTEGTVASSTIAPFQTQPPLSTQSKLKNTGNVDFVDKAKLEVRDIFGQLKYSTEREVTVLPETSRNVNFEWEEASTFGLYNVSVTHNFLDKTESKTGFVVMFPIWAIILLLGLIVLVVGSRFTGSAPAKKSSKNKK